MNNDETNSTLAETTSERNSRTHQILKQNGSPLDRSVVTTNWNPEEEVKTSEMYNEMVEYMKRSLKKLMQRMKYFITEKNHSWVSR